MSLKFRAIIQIIVLAGVILIIATGNIFIHNSKLKNNSDSEKSSISSKQYVCSMHPQVVQNSPGDCPLCGMALIEKVSSDGNEADSSLQNVVLHVNESVLSSSSVVKPVMESFPVKIDASGILTYDPRSIKTISARYNGVIDRSYIKYQFQPVRKGQKIFQVYCPDIYIERWNYVKQVQTYPDQDNLTVEARKWFKMIGLTDGQLDSLKRAPKPDYHLTVYSDADGLVVTPGFDPDDFFNSPGIDAASGQEAGKSLNLNDGVTITKGTSLFKVIDPKSLRADLRIRTEDVRLLRPRQKVLITGSTARGIEISGIIDRIEPLNGGLFQTVKIYVSDNNCRMIPGQQIRGYIIADAAKSMWLPSTSVVDMGLNKKVFLLHDNRFIATTVRTGAKTENMVEILSGINSGSEVALNGSLLVDSDGFLN